MKLIYAFTLLFIANLCVAQPSAEYHTSRIIVKFSEVDKLENIDLKNLKFNFPELDNLNKRNQIKSIRCLNKQSAKDTYVLEFNDIADIPSVIFQYYDTRMFHFVEPDYKGYGAGMKAPNDGRYGLQWGLHNDGSFNEGGSAKAGADIDMQRAWDITTGSEEIVIAVLDSGLKLDHPEFQGRLWQGQSSGKGKDFANGDDDATDDQGHGTNVTSIVAANGDNGIGFAGVDWNARIMPLKILDSDNSGFYSWWTEAIYYAVDNGARVLNMSVGGNSYSASMEDAIKYATENGAIVVACMMNTNNADTYYPAGYENTIAVGSTNPDDSRSDQFPWSNTSGSNYGAHIDISAPGNYIYGASYASNSNYNYYWSGTSQATPHVTGVISLLLSIDPDLTLESVRSILTNTAEDQVGKSTEDVEGWDQYHGHGRLNAFEALNSLFTNTEDERIAEETFTLSPNPIIQGEYLQLSFMNEGEKVITIYSASGQLILMNKTTSDLYSLNSSNLETGTYIVKVQSGNAQVSSRKFVIK